MNQTTKNTYGDVTRNEDNLLDVAVQSDYDVAWTDNGNGCNGICARVAYRDVHLSDVDGIYPDGTCYDEILVNELERVLHGVTRDTLIVLHQLGSHGPAYFKRYPPEFARFQPDCRATSFSDCSQQQIANSYDNTIAQYGDEHFGVAQSNRYRDKLKQRFSVLAEQPQLYPVVEHIRPGYHRACAARIRFSTASRRTEWK